MTDSAKTDRIIKYVTLGLIGLYAICCVYLYYRQSLADLSVGGNVPFQSDLPLHLSMVLEDGWYYSFTAFVYKALDILCMGSTIGVALFLGAVTVATVFATEKLLVQFGMKQSGKSLLLALTLNFVMPAFIPAVGEFRYVSYQCANLWHNSTYLCMRLMAIITLIVFFRLEKTYRDGISIKDWCLFALCNVITTGIKPSFLVAYSPVVGLFLIRDLIGKVSIKRILAFGSALLPSGAVILWQNAVLFGEETGNGFAFAPWKNFSMHTAIPKVAVVLSALFCLAALGYLICRNVVYREWKRLWSDRQGLFVVFTAVVSFLEALCLTEVGARSVDGNFLWGYSFGLFVLFAYCAAKWMMLSAKTEDQIAKWALLPIYGWHLYCGIYFFISLVSGIGFFM